MRDIQIPYPHFDPFNNDHGKHWNGLTTPGSWDYIPRHCDPLIILAAKIKDETKPDFFIFSERWDGDDN
jgi:hypothetical protein